MQKGYLLIEEAGRFRIQSGKYLANESIFVYKKGISDVETTLTGYTKSSWAGKPMWYSSESLGVDPKQPMTDEQIKTKVDMVANKRFWKYVGQRNIDIWEMIVIMGAGYGIMSFLLTVISKIFPGATGGGAA